MTNILIVDDDATFCIMLRTFLEKKGFSVKEAFSFTEGIKAAKANNFNVILTDIRLPDNDGLELLKEIKAKQPQVPVILMTGYGDIRTAVKAIKMGAFEYVTKPINPDEILFIIQSALRDSREDKTPAKSSFEYVTGISETAAKLNEYISLVAPTNMSVLIMGDSGTGKEYVARKIHKESDRASKPFVAIDCGALPKDLAASEFFGHLKGSFTGAITDKTGQFVEANGGTLFLDEIGNLSYDVQIQLLRAIQERKVKPVGSNKEILVDVRIITATNEDLSQAVQRGNFREDLYHRLNEFTLQVPRLAERNADLMLFANHFLHQANKELNRNVQKFDDRVVTIFKSYPWPGNIREMRNVIRRSVLLTKGDSVTSDTLPQEMVTTSGSALLAQAITGDDLKETIDKIEYEKIKAVLEKVKYNKTKAAQLLNIDRKTLYNKLRQFNIET
jgi:Response regulator containing CheY-like receiver, AAA-type ATPase, and DNA-binding domains